MSKLELIPENFQKGDMLEYQSASTFEYLQEYKCRYILIDHHDNEPVSWNINTLMGNITKWLRTINGTEIDLLTAEICDTCHGKGHTEREPLGHEPNKPIYEGKCPKCNGTGFIVQQTLEPVDALIKDLKDYNLSGNQRGVLGEHLIRAHMAGQSEANIDPSYSNACAYLKDKSNWNNEQGE